jgi:hypothetical protein
LEPGKRTVFKQDILIAPCRRNELDLKGHASQVDVRFPEVVTKDAIGSRSAQADLRKSL